MYMSGSTGNDLPAMRPDNKKAKVTKRKKPNEYQQDQGSSQMVA
jgi:hypothetical protein